MESVWAHESPCEKFLRQLRRERAIMFMKNREYMKGLRHDNERALQDQKAFGKIWKEYGTNVYQLIAEACGEVWDDEDEEKRGCIKKKEAAVNQSDHDDLVRTREKGPRERQHQFQGKSEASKRLVEKEQGQSPRGKKA